MGNKLAEILARNGGQLPPLAGGAHPMAGALPAAAPEGYGSVPGVAPPEVPFDQASHSVIEEGPSWTGLSITAAEQILEQKSIPANGFMRNIWLEVVFEEAGEEAEGEAAENFPENVISRLQFQDQGGHTISSMTGFNWYLAAKYGRYMGMSDLHELPIFSNAMKKPGFMLMIPCEIAPTGFGALTNMTEATKYQLQPSIAPEASIYKKKPKKLPGKLSIKTWIELWPLPQAMTEPEPGFPNGRPQQQRPPLEGTIQYWTEQSQVKVQTGENQFLLNRVGQMLRTHIFVCYNTAAEPLRTDATMPNPVQFLWARVLFRVSSREMLKVMARSALGGDAKAVETGVFPIIYSLGQGRFAGDNGVNTWLPTVNSTRMELRGAFTEGLITVLTNDIAVAAVSEVGRREVPGQTSMHAPRGLE